MQIVVHVAKNGKRYWQLYYVDPVTEQRTWRSTRTTDRREAERAAARWEAELADGAGDRPNRLTWEQFRNRFESEHLASVADKTAAAYRTAMNAFEQEIAPARLSSVTADALSLFARQLRDRGTLAETSIGTYLQHLSSALQWAVGVGLLRSRPTKPRTRGTSQARHRPATGEELDRMLAAVATVSDCRHDPLGWQRYLRGLNLSGLRLAESLRLSWDQAEPFCVQQQHGEWSYRIYADAQKNRKSQVLPITPDFAELLAATRVADCHGPVFPLIGKSGDLIRGQNTVSRVLEAIADAAHCTVRAHDFRRSFGTRWATRVLPAVLQQLMRHAQISTTMKYYVHLQAEDLSAALRSWQVNPLVNPSPISPPNATTVPPAENEKTPC
jgi:integrase